MFSILIPTWNNLPFLQLAVRTLLQHSSAQHELLVHVNDGSDGTLEWVRSQGIAHTHSPSNVGICTSMNRLAQLASRPLLLYWNDDMAALPGWDAPLMAAATQLQEQAFLLSATMIEPTESRNPCVVHADFGRTPDTFREQDLISSLPGLRRGDWLGSTWPPSLVSTALWHEVGGYSIELSPGMSSDNDFSMKLWHAGCRIFAGLGDSLVYHFACATTGRVVKNNGRQQFLRKWGLSQRDFDRVALQRGLAATREQALAPRAWSQSDETAWQRARSRGNLKIRFT